ncbi:XRE family transcriptional regulator [Kribbella sp. CA-293567]|uniref:XRE family transcriptional regulator n=1 Tax=Kribbella sp. CA-293567 TaxID=3002436 RepID=UPI0022DDA531|nr:XRE family transcriptional regulator [Kribbella sp. CA-293567]WBQ04336.1 XRE family transcriptional regulator [Kribbella sp. CA-293567]
MTTLPGSPSAEVRLREELNQTLRNGPFSAALHLAIERSGLTLGEIRDWLGERGAHLSLATLSYWRRGRSRPERAKSLDAVKLLESLLDLPQDGLVALLGPRRARGRWIGHITGSVTPHVLFGDHRPERVLEEIGIGHRGRLRRMSTQVQVEVGPERLVHRICVREVIEALVDRVTHCGVLYIANEEPDRPPRLRVVRNARLGEVRVDRTVGLIAAEMVFDRVLQTGDRALLEYEWHFDQGMHVVNYEHRFIDPVREYLLEACFAAEAIPAHCRRYDRRTALAPESNQTELWIGGSGTALVAETDVPAGIVGMRWMWSEQPSATG